MQRLPFPRHALRNPARGPLSWCRGVQFFSHFRRGAAAEKVRKELDANLRVRFLDFSRLKK